MSLENLALDARALIGETRSFAFLERLSVSVWEDWGAAKLTDAQAQDLAESIAARRRELRGGACAARAAQTAVKGPNRKLSYFPERRRQRRSPDRQASIERRRTLAASGPMPVRLARHFTTGELAALRIVADAVRDKKQCRLTLGEIAARAGICVTTARNALRLAARLGLVTVQERRRHRRPNLPNIIRIVSQEWILWIERNQRQTRPAAPMQTVMAGGCKKAESTDKEFAKKKSRVPLLPNYSLFFWKKNPG